MVLAGALVVSSSFSLSAQNNDFEKSFQQGIAAMRSAHWEEAVSDFQHASHQAPSFAPAFLNLGLAQLQTGQIDNAIVALRRAQSLDPKLAGEHMFLGIALYRKSDYGSAIAALQHEIQLQPKSAEAWMWLGVAQLGLGDPTAAVASLDHAAKLDPKNVDILYHRGRAHMLVSKESYEQMYAVAPDSSRVHEVLAQSFSEADRMEDAVKECELALTLKPQEPGLHEELGDIYWKQNSLEQAERAFQEELKVDADSLSSKYKLAVVSLERSKPEAAAALLTQLLHQAPDYPGAHYQLGRAYAQMGQVDLAITNFKAVITSAHAGDSEMTRQSYYQLAQLYRRAQRPEDSKLALDAFLRLKQQSDAAQAQKLADKLKRASEEHSEQP